MGEKAKAIGVSNAGFASWLLKSSPSVQSGGAILVLVCAGMATAALLTNQVAMVGLVGLATVGGIAMVLRVFGRRLQAMHHIRQGLVAVAGGERSKDALAVRGELSIEAEGWNQLLEEHDELAAGDVAERASEMLESRGRTKSELASACDAMWLGLIVADHQRQAKYVNGAAAVLLQGKIEAMIGQEVTSFFEDVNVVSAINDAIDGTTTHRQTLEMAGSQQGEGGMLRVNVRPVRRKDPAAAIILIEDVTQMRSAENASRSFVAHATHELRTPLTNIRLYAECLLEDDTVDTQMRAKALNVINQETLRLERIVGDMLSISEIEAGSFQLKRDDVRLSTLIEEMEHDYQAQAKEKQLTLEFDASPKLPVLHGDRDKIAMAMHNLVGNGIKYTPPGGRVKVTLEATDTQVVFEVQDTGIGIGEADRQRVFEKFYRARDDRVTEEIGSGLGLALAREVIRLHGGDITVESEIDKGSTFSMRLPIRSVGEREDAEAADESAEAA